MTRPVIIRPEAESDLIEACEWYDRQAAGLSEQYLQQVDQTLTRIQENPRLYTQIHKTIRRALIRRFPFGIFYMEEGEKIVVLAVMNQAQDPARWQERVR